jgi:hypothetical protein
MSKPSAYSEYCKYGTCASSSSDPIYSQSTVQVAKELCEDRGPMFEEIKQKSSLTSIAEKMCKSRDSVDEKPVCTTPLILCQTSQDNHVIKTEAILKILYPDGINPCSYMDFMTTSRLVEDIVNKH